MRSVVTYVGSVVGLACLLGACSVIANPSLIHPQSLASQSANATQGQSENNQPQSQGNRTPFLTVANSNWGEVSNAEDYLSSEVAIVYQDGSVEFYREYNLRGKVDLQQRQLTDAEFTELRGLIGSLDDSISRKGGVDGVGWRFDIHDAQGVVSKSSEGYLGANTPSERIVAIVMPQRLQE